LVAHRSGSAVPLQDRLLVRPAPLGRARGYDRSPDRCRHQERRDGRLHALLPGGISPVPPLVTSGEPGGYQRPARRSPTCSVRSAGRRLARSRGCASQTSFTIGSTNTSNGAFRNPKNRPQFSRASCISRSPSPEALIFPRTGRSHSQSRLARVRTAARIMRVRG